MSAERDEGGGLMGAFSIELLGWAATAVFVGSYFCSRPSRLRAVQMFGAGMWVVYGLVIHAVPVVAANVLVLAAAAWTAMARRRGTASV